MNNPAHNPVHTRQGIIYVILGLSLASLAGAMMKLLTEDLNAFQITWFRFSGFALIMLPIVLIRFGIPALKPARPGIQIVRGISMAGSTITFTIGVQTVDFADAIAILYAYPFLLILLAVAFLREQVQWSGWVGVIGGFIGVLLIMRPQFSAINTGTMYVFLCSVIVSIQMVLNRKLGTLSHPLITSFWGAIVATIALSVLLPFFWQPISLDKLWLIGLLIICGAISQTLVVFAFAKAGASTLAPFTYFEIIAAVIIGYFMFGTLPVWISWIGITLISVSGLIVAKSLPRQNPRGRVTKI